MSCSYTAGLVVGVRVSNKDLYTEEIERGCKHQIDEGVNFCPECGVPTTKMVSKPLPGYNEDDRYSSLDVCRIISCEDPEYVVGKRIKTVHGEPWKDRKMVEPIDFVELATARTTVATALSGDPILEKGEFGIWLAMYVSY